MKLSLGFSPCPNDTFIFDALVNNKIDTGGLSFEVVLEDVETLNEWALGEKLDITKLSYGVLSQVLDSYVVLNSGSALGTGTGPLLIANKEAVLNVDEQNIALPGKHTTAHALFSSAYPLAENKIFMRYDRIEDFVLEGKGLGVIIHENRFTYAAKGLHKVADLGEHWEKTTGKPVPLGGIVIKRSVDTAIKLQVNELIKKSIEYAFANHYTELTDYVKVHAREMSEAVMRKHIELYVNSYTRELGDEGKLAVQELLKIQQNILNSKPFELNQIFLAGK
jgi:1,4-dihydroxy-6-naphthoate synthase